jgi:hypothetical protein
MQEELLTFEREFTQAVVSNDPAAIGRFVADDWVIVMQTDASLKDHVPRSDRVGRFDT